MRDIKFRAWDAENKHMVYSMDEPVGDADSCLLYLFTQFQDNSFGVIPEGSGDRLPTMQYTGLKDKHGVEIYEGDIVRLYGNYLKRGIVEYSAPHFFIFDGKDGAYSDFTWEEWESDFEVIGNTHENPELIEE